MPAMDFLVAIVAIVAVFGTPTYLIKRWMDLREKRLELEIGARKEVARLEGERKLLAERVDALEAIVLSGDYELEQQIKRAAIAQEAKDRAKLGPAPDSEG